LTGSISTAIYWLLILLFGAFGYWLQSWPKAELAARRRLRDWRKTTGTVTSSHLEEIQAARLSLPDRLLKMKADVYKPVISYTYLVGSKTYQSSKYKNSFVARGEEWVTQDPKIAADLLAAHPPGQTVTVAYDPADPATAYLELDSSISRLFVFRISGILLLLSAALFFMRSAYGASSDMLAGRTPTQVAAVFPLPSAEIRAGITSSLGLTCQYNGIYHETYESWLCKDPPGAAPASVHVYSRKEDLEKTDYLIAKASQPDAPAFFTDLFRVVLPRSDPLQFQAWIAKTAPSLSQSGDQAETSIDNVLFVLSVPSKNTLQLDIGELKQ
jgi:hypothetical protein